MISRVSDASSPGPRRSAGNPDDPAASHWVEVTMRQRDSTPSAELGALGFLLAEEGRDRHGLRLGLVGAAVLHVFVFAVTWPTLTREARAVEDTTVRVYEVQKYTFEPPVDPVEMPRRPARTVPIPDQDPLDPEPYVREEPAQVVEFHPDDLTFDPETIAPPPAPEPEVLRVGVHVEPPEILHRVEPHYPEAALRARMPGTVILEFFIGPDGTVRDLTVLRGAPLGMTESAVAGAHQWRFEPSTIDGRPVAVKYVLTIRFEPV